MIKLLSIIYDKDKAIGYINDGKYKIFTSSRAGEYEVKEVAGTFKNYEHFAMVIGKFDPEFLFIKEPKIVKSLKYDDLIEVGKEYPQL